MVDMTHVIQKMGMLFAIMVLGYIGNRCRVLDEEGNKKFSTLVVNITAPALILASSSDRNLSGSRYDALFVLLVAVCMYIFLILVSFFVRFIFGIKKGQEGVFRFMTIFGNNAFMGIPVVDAVFGNVFYAALFNLPNNILIYSYGGYLLSGKKTEGRHRFRIRNIINPGVLSATAALIMFLFGLKFPEPVTDGLLCVGNITTPLSMIVIGSSLAAIPVKETLKDVRVYLFSLFKLVVLPFIIFLIGRCLISDPLVLGVLVVISAMPCAAVTVMLCNEYRNDAKKAAQYVFISTVLSVITIPCVAYLLSGKLL